MIINQIGTASTGLQNLFDKDGLCVEGYFGQESASSTVIAADTTGSSRVYFISCKPNTIYIATRPRVLSTKSDLMSIGYIEDVTPSIDSKALYTTANRAEARAINLGLQLAAPVKTSAKAKWIAVMVTKSNKSYIDDGMPGMAVYELPTV